MVLVGTPRAYPTTPRIIEPGIESPRHASASKAIASHHRDLNATPVPALHGSSVVRRGRGPAIAGLEGVFKFPKASFEATAESEAALARLKAIDPEHYSGLQALLDSVASGAIRPLKGRYIIELDERGGRLQRRQDLPPEAFWTAAELERVARALGDDFGMLFVALSYRWLKKGDPGV